MSWRITFLGRVSATREGKTLTRFESSRTVALLARLALFPHRTHPREELVELLWPDVEREVALVRLRHTLRTLRQPLESGLPAGSVLIADRTSIRVNPEALRTDVAEFERALQQKDSATARTLYVGELLPGLYDDWVLEERYRLEALAEGLTRTAEGVPPPPEVPAERSGGPLSLPLYLTAFFGRAHERDAVAQLLTHARLVTLTGLGGTGKTRLSVELLRDLAPSFPQASFVALGECVVAAQVPGRIRDVLGLPAVSADALEQVTWALRDTPALLVLDNVEQLVDSGGAELVEALLTRLPQLTLLVTSRRALGLPGERLFPLEPLSPQESQALFLDRVQATRPGFHLTAGNQADIAAVCQGLEGIPLALELAAARIRAFSPAEMRRELQSRFEWLARTGLRGDKDDRHRSLATALEWSWRLLSPSQQRFLANLSLFRAPFRAGDAAAITGYHDARERLEDLGSDSLVQSASEDDGETRYTLLETVREFGVRRIQDLPEARQRFQHHYLRHPRQEANTTVAWEYALEEEAGDTAHAFATTPEWEWISYLGIERARELLERTTALPSTEPRLRMLVANRLAQCYLRLNRRQEAIALMDRAAEALTHAPAALLAETLSHQAHISLFDAPREKTEALLERCLTLAQDPFVRAEALRLKGCLLSTTPDYERAEPLFAEAAQLYAPEAVGQYRLLYHRAHLARRRQQFDEAQRLYQLCSEKALLTQDHLLHKTCQSNLADIFTCQGRWEEALVQNLACLETEEAYGDQHILLVLLWNLARPFLEVGQPERAVRLMSASATLWEREVRPLSEEEHEELGQLRQDLLLALGEAGLAQGWSEGATLSLKQALALARS